MGSVIVNVVPLTLGCGDKPKLFPLPNYYDGYVWYSTNLP